MIDGPTILTADGLYFHFDQPQAETISINAIARGLANTCRFGGQCERFYSVAEHSIHVSYLVPEHLALEGLLHDAAEAFIGDMPKPLKEVLPDYQAVESRVEAVIFRHFGIGPLSADVKHADRVMLATEQRQLMENQDRWRWTDQIQPLDLKLACFSPGEAYQAFLRRWEILK